MKVKKVYKYGTGDIIPEGAVYLCTKTETLTTKEEVDNPNSMFTKNGDFKKNVFVWHYFLCSVEDDGGKDQ